MRLVAYCLMRNHFHLVVMPHGDGDLSRWMQWLMTTHVRRYLKHYGHSGHVWQGRFKAFAIQDDGHLFTVVRYVERNALRTGLVSRAQDWPCSSIGIPSAGADSPPQLAIEDFIRPTYWADVVNAPMTDDEAKADAIRLSIRRNRPYGSEGWIRATVTRLGRESNSRSLGRQHRHSVTQTP
jgi:putative transposase